MAHLELTTLIVREYNPAIEFFVTVLNFELVEDKPSTTNDGRPKRWVVVRPRGGQTGLLLARADGEQQAAAAGDQFAGRVGLFLRVDDFDATCARLREAGAEFVKPPRQEPYGRVAVFRDLEGNRWDLLEAAGAPNDATSNPHPGTQAWVPARVARAVLFWFLLIIIPIVIIQLSSS